MQKNCKLRMLLRTLKKLSSSSEDAGSHDSTSYSKGGLSSETVRLFEKKSSRCADKKNNLW